ncbi:MAG: sugar phosphate isomerase/epimerase family protein [Pseudomonadota bacterium]
MTMNNRREFVGMVTLAMAAPGLAAAKVKEPWFRISLAEWSFNRTLFGNKMTNLDFPVLARKAFGIESVEYVNQFWMDKAEDKGYLAELKKRCDDNGVKSGLIMCDKEGALGDADAAARTKAIENHYKWVTAAKYLGCHSIRVNAQSSGTFGAQLDNATDGLRRLAQFAAQHNINVVVENHGGNSSNGKWLASVIEQVDLPNCGTLPDFGNFNVAQGKAYDRYLGTTELMPFARGVSAKSYAFDAKGDETTIDYLRIMRIVRDAGYRGYVGIEFEGRNMEETEGVRATKKLLERVREELAPA